jgi:parallel beta-helix repeat protein
MKNIYLLGLLLALPAAIFAQTILPITNNMVVTSNSNIKFIPGNYTFTDPELNGVIQLNGVSNVTLDGDSCYVNGVGFGGYMIKISNSHNVLIKNFDSVYHYKYAVYVTNSDHIIINGNDFSRNKVDSSGTINVWADYTSALGGGVMMYQCRVAQIFDNIMKEQNDGVAAYHCDSIYIANNDFNWNTSFGIRLFWTDSCKIYNNLAAHVNRPYTDPSDCAAILLIISNANDVQHNDFSYSGDGIFLGQYQHSNIPNNNYFAWNECSYSPHNAIEATFADGNVYKHNNCNVSDYGLWLGYSFNSIVDSNEIRGNFHDGIAIDRGYNNTITNNTIFGNPIGIDLWKGSSISGYENQTSHDYYIGDNVIEGNTLGLSAKITKHMVVEDNQFLYNEAQGIYIEDTITNDTVSGNTFHMTTGYHIRNWSAMDLYAMGNAFAPNDTAMISEKIYDHRDNSAKGTVNWYPPEPGPAPVMQYDPPCDMAEPGSTWYAYPQTGYPGPRIADTVYFDYDEKQVGEASVKLVSGRGWDVGLNYRPGNDSVSQWTLNDNDTLYFWVRTIKNPFIGFQGFSIRIGDRKGNYFRYTASTALLDSANNLWVRYKFPLSGDNVFFRASVGPMTWDEPNYVEIHADTWDYGYTLWVDGLQFSPCYPPVGINENVGNIMPSLQIIPNPCQGTTTARYFLAREEPVRIIVTDEAGKLLRTIIRRQPAGMQETAIDLSGFAPGIYFCTLITAESTTTKKIIRVK